MNQQLKESDLIAISLYLLYIPQKIIELQNKDLQSTFVEEKLAMLTELAFEIVSSSRYADNVALVQNMLRQLTTSFLSLKRDCEIIGRMLM